MINFQLHAIVQKSSISELYAPGTDKTDTIWSRAFTKKKLDHFYIGTPLTTESLTRIGSLWVNY